VRLLRGKLRQRGCVNQGYVLDGWPKTIAVAEALFPDEEERGGEREEDLGLEAAARAADYEERAAPEDPEDAWAAGLTDPADPPQRPPPTRPRLVLALDAADEFLADRVMALPPAQQLAGSARYSEAAFKRRLQAFRARTTETASVLNFFEERDVAVVGCGAMGAVMPAVATALGRPHNYGPTAAELADVHRQQQREDDRRHEARRAEQARAEAAERSRRAHRDARERERLAAIQAQESENLNVHALPLRSYLLTNVLPTVTEALIEICKVRPDDPLEYLAS
jgi:adenylate kinase